MHHILKDVIQQECFEGSLNLAHLNSKMTGFDFGGQRSLRPHKTNFWEKLYNYYTYDNFTQLFKKGYNYGDDMLNRHGCKLQLD